MFPDIVKIGGVAIHTYGFLIAVGIICALYVAKKECERVGLAADKVIDILFWGIWAGIIGSRIFYVFYFPGEFVSNPLEIIKIWKGGLVFHGGLLSAVPVVLYLLNKHKIPIIKTFDSVIIGVPLAHFFGRLGCFAAGCCYGKECDLPWSVVFTHPETIAPRNIPLHPVQLYESFLNATLFFALFFTRKKITREGMKLGIYLTGYGAIRFFVEFFRGDPRGIYGDFSSAQWISVVFFAAGSAFMFRAMKAKIPVQSSKEKGNK